MGKEQSIRAEIRANLPAEAFKPQPWVGWLAPILVVSIGGLSWFLLHYQPPWYSGILISLILGQMYATLTFLAHEACHGAVFRSRWAQDVVGYFGFFLYAFTPTLWRVWHNQLHHGNTNLDTTDPIDPDAAKHIEIFYRNQHRPMVRKMLRVYPGSYHWWSYLYPFLGFTLQAAAVLWVLSGDHPDYYNKLNRKRAIIEHLFIILFWIGFSIWIGLANALFVVIFPMIIANFILNTYIMTNHLLRPMVDHDNPLKHSMSVTSYPWVDWMNLRFSHHVEHHFFPTISFQFTSQVRKILKKNHPEEFLAPAHWKAVWMVYQRPSFFMDANTFINPNEEKGLPIQEIETALKIGKWRLTG